MFRYNQYCANLFLSYEYIVSIIRIQDEGEKMTGHGLIGCNVDSQKELYGNEDMVIFITGLLDPSSIPSRREIDRDR